MILPLNIENNLVSFLLVVLSLLFNLLVLLLYSSSKVFRNFDLSGNFQSFPPIEKDVGRLTTFIFCCDFVGVNGCHNTIIDLKPVLFQTLIIGFN